MSMQQEELEQLPPQGHVKVVYLGPTSPHWEVHGDNGDGRVIDEFRQRATARLQLLPPHDPQFRRNRERVIRDAERENLLLEWDLGHPEDDYQPATPAPAAEPAPVAAAAEDGDGSPEAEAASARAAAATAE
jgi:hypothetical protein